MFHKARCSSVKPLSLCHICHISCRSSNSMLFQRIKCFTQSVRNQIGLQICLDINVVDFNLHVFPKLNRAMDCICHSVPFSDVGHRRIHVFPRCSSSDSHMFMGLCVLFSVNVLLI
ncbi:hypothetical protein ATANTOWER_003516 [Ataeniobius toweri]|uniref:Uncharacterized protein n=1 Tax=Ataeniobius toweri TaxID=208326 RepID=A0ABU7BE14_9TELE|nr:hypothetical protein [Ataeniobius toweri]